MKLAFPDANDALGNAPSASMFRVVRLVRLVRLLRVLQMPIFQDLIAMIQGLIGGLSTLAWAVVLFGMIMYVWSLLFREFFGRQEKENISRYFSSVPRAMYTTFRCAFGDCSSNGGVPIFEHVQDEYGWFFSGVYCIFVFMVAVGLFNVISAIFVEALMAVSMAQQSAKLHSRLADENLWEENACRLIIKYMEVCGHPIGDKHGDDLRDCMRESWKEDEIGPVLFEK